MKKTAVLLFSSAYSRNYSEDSSSSRLRSITCITAPETAFSISVNIVFLNFLICASAIWIENNSGGSISRAEAIRSRISGVGNFRFCSIIPIKLVEMLARSASSGCVIPSFWRYIFMFCAKISTVSGTRIVWCTVSPKDTTGSV